MVKFVDIAYIITVREVKNGYMYILDGKNDVYRVFSKRYFDDESVVYVYSDGNRYFISDK